MGNRTTDFDSPLQNRAAFTPWTIATGAVIPAGCLVQLDNSGLLRNVDATSTNKIVGRASVATDGTEAAGTQIGIDEGDIFLTLGGTADPTQASAMAAVYADSNYQISTTNTKPKVGLLLRLATGPDGSSGAIVRCTLATS